MLCSSVLIRRKTTTLTGRNVLTLITGEILASNCFTRKVPVSFGVNLHLFSQRALTKCQHVDSYTKLSLTPLLHGLFLDYGIIFYF